ASNDHISRDAPPARRFRFSTAIGPSPICRATYAASRPASSVDVIEVLRPAVTGAPSPRPLGEALCDPGGHARAPVAQRDHGEDPSRDALDGPAVDGLERRED